MIAEQCVEGKCTFCGKDVWRFAIARRDDKAQNIKAGQRRNLWPAPDSVYAVLQDGENIAPGVAFCAECRPEIGDVVLKGFGPVLKIESAHQRYRQWFDPRIARARRAWLSDALSLDPALVESLMQVWESDRPRITLG